MRVLVIAVILTVANLGVLAQQEPSKIDFLHREVDSSEDRPMTMPESFQTILGKTRIPGGLVQVSGCNDDNPKRTWDLAHKPVGELLHELVAFDPRYRWEIRNDTINLLPAVGEPPFLQSQIGIFSIQTDSSLDALDRLESLPEFKNAMKTLRLTGGLTIISYLSNSRQFSLNFKGGTLRDALNAVAAAKGSDIWQYKETHCGDRNEVTIKF